MTDQYGRNIYLSTTTECKTPDCENRVLCVAFGYNLYCSECMNYQLRNLNEQVFILTQEELMTTHKCGNEDCDNRIDTLSFPFLGPCSECMHHMLRNLNKE